MPALLAFDTSTETMSVALSVAGRVYARDALGGALASARLVPAIMSLLEEAGTRLHDLDAIAFGQGPGAFTGLRTACSVAQGLALGAAKPVLPISSLLAVAQDALADVAAGRVWVTVDARMSEIYAAHYERRHGQWHVLCEPKLYTLEALHQRWQAHPPEQVAGNAIALFEGRLQVGRATLFAQASPCGRALLPLAQALWQQAGAVSAEHALPLYLRDNVAQTVAQREASRAAKQALGAAS
jgi:tRNA threonylcarbamoyladenosine biosynthesis protein TsaB